MSKKISSNTYILFSFIILIIIASFLLVMPFSLTKGSKITFFDALFISTSAITVTGLTTLDISITFSIMGKMIILILIQLGGLGIITFSSMIVLLISRKIGYYTKKTVDEDLNKPEKINIYTYIKGVASLVFIIEIIGIFFLYIIFREYFDVKSAIFYAIFHSISAFCNAGFSLFSNNFENYTLNISLNIIISMLIIFGSLGFSVLIDLYNYFTKKINKITINSKFSLIITVNLLFIGTLSFFIFEYSNLNKLGYNFFSKILISFFHSVSSRTAGFNSIAMSNLTYPTIIILCILMFIGANPGSTGGGIKTNTIGLIFLGIKSIIKNKENIEYSNKTINKNAFNKAIALLFIVLSYLFFAILIISIFDSDKKFLDLIFELFSAMGTVGLSTGITSKLSIISKILIIITMFLGRVGPLTVILALSKVNKAKIKYKYPEENILIG